MKRLSAAVTAALALLCAMPVSVCAQDTSGDDANWIEINLESAGTLGVEVLYKVNTLADVQYLRVSGPLNDADWTTLKNMGAIVGLDLSSASATAVPAKEFYQRTSLKQVQLPAVAASIGDQAFYGSGLTSVAIPAAVTSLGKECFSNCKTLAEATVGDGVQSIPNGCFGYCDALVKVVLPGNLTLIDQYAFYESKKLADIQLPQALTAIGAGAFRYCEALRDVVFPESLKTIGSSAYYNSGITRAALPERLTSLGSSAFEYCRSLNELVLPATIYEYTNGEFRYDSAITSITCRTATAPRINSTTFYYLERGNVTVSVPDFAVVHYKLDTEWLQFGAIQGGVNGSYWAISGDLALTNDRRMDGIPSIDIFNDGRLTVGGNAPMPVNRLTLQADLRYNYQSYGQLLNNSPAMTANSAALSLYVSGNRWYFISLPCPVKRSALTHGAGGSLAVRRYDGQSRAANGTGANWKDLGDGDTLEHGQGYILQADRDGYVNIELDAEGITALLAAGHRSLALHSWSADNAANAGWNLAGNPSFTYFDLASTPLTCPVTLWDDNNRCYTACSLIDDDVVLAPGQAFFIQHTDGDAEVTFDAKGRQFTSQVSRPSVSAARAAVSRSGGGRAIYNLTLAAEGEARADRTRVVFNDGASTGYEPQCDASKFLADGVAQLYTVDAEGNRLAINERPAADGRVRLGVYAPRAGASYTIGCGRADGGVTLHDAITGRSVSLGAGDAYAFTATQAGHTDDRFTLTLGQYFSGVSMTAAGCSAAVTAAAGCILVNGMAGGDVEVYTVDGRLAASARAAQGDVTLPVPAGMYIVRTPAGAAKCIVK